MCVLAVVEADADVQIKVAVAHGRRAREFILHLGDLQADACEPIQDVEQFVGGLTQNSSSREIFEITSVAAVVVGELLCVRGRPFTPGSFTSSRSFLKDSTKIF